MDLKLFAPFFLVKLFSLVSSAPLREGADSEPVYHVVRINASVGASRDCEPDTSGGNDGRIEAGVTVVLVGESPWSVNQELVKENRCPEPLSDLCEADDGESYTSPFFQGDIILTDETREMIRRAKEERENQVEEPEENIPTENTPSEDVPTEDTTPEDEHREHTGDGHRVVVHRPTGHGGNRRVVITTTTTRHRTGSHRGGGYSYSRHIGRSHVRHHYSGGSLHAFFGRSKRALVKPKEFRWDNGIIPFTIDSNLPDDYKTVIRMGMRHWEKKTCVDFVPRKKQKDYLRFAFYPGCWSFIGKQGGEQILSIGFTCNTMRTVVHEIGHAVGLWHEQSRRDRDKYIRVVTANIAPGALENFEKIDVENITSLGFAYDFDSVMHYDALAFTMNGAPTLKVRKEYRDVPSTELGMKERLSDIDIAQVNAMYECNQKKPLPEECFESKTGKGEDYRGEINYTEDFITCQKWTAQWPNKHEQYSSKERKNERNGLGDHNFCRNPDGKRKRPWCFTTHKKIRWQFCPVKLC